MKGANLSLAALVAVALPYKLNSDGFVTISVQPKYFKLIHLQPSAV